MIQYVVFAVNKLFPQQHSKIIKAIKHLKSALESTIEAAWLFIYYNALFVTFNTLVNQKHHQH